MNAKRPSGKDPLSSLCAEVGSEDGLDPRRFLRGPSARVPNRKALQLCAQVKETLEYALAWECGDRLLQGLTLEGVEPAPNSSRLLVTVRAEGSADPGAVTERLGRASARLRIQVAEAIHRKRVPELTFRVVRRDQDVL